MEPEKPSATPINIFSKTRQRANSQALARDADLRLLEQLKNLPKGSKLVRAYLPPKE